MVKVLLSHLRLSQDDLKGRPEVHTFKMKGNEAYKEFQPMIAELETLSSTYGVALMQSELGGSDRTEVKNKAKEALNAYLTKMSKTVELKANELPNDEAAKKFVTNAGFEIFEKSTKKKAKITYDYLATPLLKVVNNSRHGVLDCSWSEVPGAEMYLIFEVDKDGRMTKCGHAKETKVQLTGVEQVRKTYCLVALGDDMVESDCSASVTVNVD